ncbi:hypothetical protein [Leifsonia poae]|uniref:hypothetical protein n=1 Tax=Leifsonia poae TaxID=110933 RepID=UPI003D669854
MNLNNIEAGNITSTTFYQLANTFMDQGFRSGDLATLINATTTTLETSEDPLQTAAELVLAAVVIYTHQTANYIGDHQTRALIKGCIAAAQIDDALEDAK